MSTTYEVATWCENHDVAGSCTEECAVLENMMSGDGYSEPMVYSDYLGGTSSIDVSGCHGGPERPEVFYRFDPQTRSVRQVTKHPVGCGCAKHPGAMSAEDTAMEEIA